MIMNKIIINPNNKKYYSDDFIKGFECGVERQYEEDMKQDTAEWEYKEIPNTNIIGWWCSNCHMGQKLQFAYCPNCGAKMKESGEE